MNGQENNFEYHFISGVNYLTSRHGSDKDDPVLPISKQIVPRRDPLPLASRVQFRK